MQFSKLLFSTWIIFKNENYQEIKSINATFKNLRAFSKEVLMVSVHIPTIRIFFVLFFKLKEYK